MTHQNLTAGNCLNHLKSLHDGRKPSKLAMAEKYQYQLTMGKQIYYIYYILAKSHEHFEKEGKK